MRRLLLLSFVFVASSCGSNSGFSCHHGSDGISVSVGSNLDASDVHHSVVDNSTGGSPDNQSSPGSSVSPGNQSSTSGDNQSSPDGPTISDSPVSEIDPDSLSPDDSPDGLQDNSTDQSSIPGDDQSSTVSLIDPSSDDSPDQSSTTSLDLPDPEVASGESSDFPATYFVIWNGKSYEPSDCITVMWGRLCLSAK